MTLIELLTVVSIMLIVTVIAVPAMKPALENRKIREAARAVNVYLGSARNHAIELGRPVGVLLTRDVTQGNPCLTLQQVEIPASYAGDTGNSTAEVYYNASNSNPNLSLVNADGTVTYTVTITFPSAQPVNANLFHGGDLIQFNYQGPLYTIAPNPMATSAAAPTSTSATATINLPPNSMLPWPSTSQGVRVAVPFQITRQPDFSNGTTLATQSAVAPLTLPPGTVVDLQSSGTNTGVWFGTGTANPAMLIFSPAGGVYGVFTNGSMNQLIDPVYFLIGRRDRMFTLNMSNNVTYTSGRWSPQAAALATDIVPADGLANWQDLNNLWVSVTPQTGRITTVENAAVTASVTNVNGIVAARRFALQSESKGGR